MDIQTYIFEPIDARMYVLIEGNSALIVDPSCQTAHCGRYIPHFDFGAKPSPIVPYRHLPQSLSGMTADCRSLV